MFKMLIRTQNYLFIFSGNWSPKIFFAPPPSFEPVQTGSFQYKNLFKDLFYLHYNSTMDYKCSKCDFESKWVSSTRRHFNRKHTEKTGIIDVLEKNVDVLEKNVDVLGKNVDVLEKNVDDFVNNLDDTIQCDKCQKNLCNSKYLLKHKMICKGVKNKFECSKCHIVYSSYSSLSHHKKICKINTDSNNENITIIENQTNNITNITNNDNRQIINNDNRITNNITLQIRNFGEENKDYITNAFLLQCYNNGYYGLIEMIENVYFNNDHPENHNVRIGSLKNKYLEIHKDDKWVPQGINETLNRMINITASDIILNVDDTEKEIEKIIEIQNPDLKKEKLLKESINGKLIARKKFKDLSINAC